MGGEAVPTAVGHACLRNSAHDVQAVGDLPPDRVARGEGGVLVYEEELRTTGARSGVRHSDRPCRIVRLTLRREVFVGNLVARPTRAVARRIPALQNEDAGRGQSVTRGPVEEPLIGKKGHRGDRRGCVISEQVDGNIPAVGGQGQSAACCRRGVGRSIEGEVIGARRRWFGADIDDGSPRLDLLDELLDELLGLGRGGLGFVPSIDEGEDRPSAAGDDQGTDNDDGHDPLAHPGLVLAFDASGLLPLELRPRELALPSVRGGHVRPGSRCR